MLITLVSFILIDCTLLSVIIIINLNINTGSFDYYYVFEINIYSSLSLEGKIINKNIYIMS